MSAQTYFTNNFKKGKIIDYLKTDPKKILINYWRGYNQFGLNPNEGLVKALGIEKPYQSTKVKYDLLDQYVRKSKSRSEFDNNFKALYDLYDFEGKMDYKEYNKAITEVYKSLSDFEPPAMGKGPPPADEPQPPSDPPVPAPRLRGSKYQVINQAAEEGEVLAVTPRNTFDEPLEPQMSESKRVSGRKEKAKTIEKRGGIRGAVLPPTDPKPETDPVEVEITADGEFIPATPPPQTPGTENPDASAMPSQSTAEPSAPAPAPAPAPTPDPVSESMDNISRKTTKVPLEPEAGISKVDTIPKERLVTEGKSVQQLKNDLIYFKKNFKKELFRVQVDFKNNNLDYLQRKHKEIIAKLNPKKGKQDTKTGIIINASDYIKEKLKEILVENSIKGLTAKDLIVDVEGDDKPKDEDIGSYEFKVGSDGMPMAKREPVYKYIPEVNPKAVLEPKNARIKNPPTKYRGLEQTAKKMVMNDPFIKPQKAIRFKYSY